MSGRAKSPALLRRLRTGLAVLWLICAGLTITVGRSQPDGQFHTTVLDIGQGDSVLLATPAGHTILIDGGPDAGAAAAKLGAALPFWVRRVDAIVLTHPHADHLNGLIGVLEHYDVGVVVTSGVPYDSAAYRAFVQTVAAQRVPHHAVRQAERWQLEPNFTLEFLAPRWDFSTSDFEHIHESMIVVRAVYGQTAALFVGDMEAPLEAELVRSGATLSANLLKVGHHGSRTSTSPQLLAAVRPQYAVISVGRRNRYGHPHGEIPARLQSLGIRVWRTDRDGDVAFTSDGRTLWSED